MTGRTARNTGMGRWRRGLLLGLLMVPLSSVAAGPRPGGPNDGQRPEPARTPAHDHLAPAGRWYASGGSAAGTGRSLSTPVRREPETAWTYVFRGRPESEPLTWDGTAVLAIDAGRGARQLVALDLANGQVRAQARLSSPAPLRPSLWSNRIAVRAAANRVEVFRIAARRLERQRTIQARKSISAPLLFANQCFVGQDGSIVRYDLDRREPLWSIALGETIRDGLALRAGLVFALVADRRGHHELVALNADTGAVVDRQTFGGLAAGELGAASITVHEESVFVRSTPAFETRDKREYDTLRVDGTVGEWESVYAHQLRFAPIEYEAGQPLALEHVNGGDSWRLWRAQGSQVQVHVLADPETHADRLEALAPPSRAEGVTYLDGLAIDEDLRVLWRRSARPLARPVPIPKGLLLVEEETRATSRLVLLQDRAPAITPAERDALAYRSSLEAELAASYTSLAAESLRTGDVALTRRLLDEALRRGAEGTSIAKVEKDLGRRLDQARPSPIDSRLVRNVLEMEQALLRRPVEKLTERARSAAAPELKLALLREALLRDPMSEEARGQVEGLIPRTAPRGARPDPLAWIEFLAIHEESPVRFVTEANGRGYEAELLARERSRWRTDLAGYSRGGLYIIAPPNQPGAVAKALATGELVTRALDEIFGTRNTAGRTPLALLLYETKEEYVTQSQRDGTQPELARGWTAGHYSPADNLSRMYVPPDDEDWARLLEVYAHELTHHWLDMRAPFARRGGGDPRHPGFWIVEGFATLIEEFDFDLVRGTWSPSNPRAESLDIVRNATPGSLLSWERVAGLSQYEFGRLSPKSRVEIGLTWHLGVKRPMGDIQLFYAQAGAMCHYLFTAEGGKHRPALLNYVRGWYEGDRRTMDPVRTFRMGASEVGTRLLKEGRSTNR